MGLDGAPPRMRHGPIGTAPAGIAGVIDVHDLHVWTLTSQMDVEVDPDIALGLTLSPGQGSTV